MSVAQLQRISLPFSVAAFRDAHSSLFMPEDHRQNVFRRLSFGTCTLLRLFSLWIVPLSSTTLFCFGCRRRGSGLLLFGQGILGRGRGGFANLYFVSDHTIAFAGIINRYRQSGLNSLHGDGHTSFVNIRCFLRVAVVHRG